MRARVEEGRRRISTSCVPAEQMPKTEERVVKSSEHLAEDRNSAADTISGKRGISQQVFQINNHSLGKLP